MEYNTQKEHLILKEYGRNVQKLVAYISTLENKEERTAYAHALISLMKALNPSVKENSENPQRIWDHLFVMSNFDLDIDGPFPMPTPEILNKRPEALTYRTDEVKFRHYGRNVELLVKAAIAIEDPDEQYQACIKIGKLMKSFYASWNKEIIEDLTIVAHLKLLSQGQLDLTEKLKEANGHLFERPSRSDYHHRGNNSDHRYNNRGGGHNRRRGKKRRY